MIVISFRNVSKKYKLYSKGGLYLRDRITHALARLNPIHGHRVSSSIGSKLSEADPSTTLHPLERDFLALKDVSFEIQRGESVGFIGRNGAGKSTILKLLAGVTKASSGSVEVNGKVAALIEVGAGFHPELTGRENIYLNGSILGMTKADIEKCFDSIVNFAELEDFMDTPVKHYSSGMYVRLGFSIAAHTNPDVFLIDEVLAVGDAAFQKKCLATMAAHKAAGKTMIFVSHDLGNIEDICDRVIYLKQGEVKADGPTDKSITAYLDDLSLQYPANTGLQNMAGAPAARIADVVLRNVKGEEISTLNTGEDLIVEIRYHALRDLGEIKLGIVLNDEKGQKVGSFTSRTSGYAIKAPPGQHTRHCRISHLAVSKGNFWLSAGIIDATTREFYDYRNMAKKIEIKSPDFDATGPVRLQGVWSEYGCFDSSPALTTGEGLPTCGKRAG